MASANIDALPPVRATINFRQQTRALELIATFTDLIFQVPQVFKKEKFHAKAQRRKEN
jgi:hypothetical protein